MSTPNLFDIPTNDCLSGRDIERLQKADPRVIGRVTKVLWTMAFLGHPMTVAVGWRSTQEQINLYAQGHTKAGPIVTNADGVRNRSKHQDGYAVDLMFQGPEPFGEAHPWRLYGEVATACQLEWGGFWTLEKDRARPDRPHVQLPAAERV